MFYIWLGCVIPGEHGRTKWWIVGFLIPFVNFVVFFVYAFTMPRDRAVSESLAVA